MSVLRVALAAAVVVFLICLPQTARSEMNSRGAGAQTCGEFAEHYRIDSGDAETGYFSWAQGFMSAWNIPIILDDGTYTDLDDSRFNIDAQQSHIRSYCDEHPLASYSIRPNRLRTST